jgi:hypothetical protein
MRAKKHILELTYSAQINFRTDAPARGKASEADSRRAPLSTWPAGLDPWLVFNFTIGGFGLCMSVIAMLRIAWVQ